MKKYLRFIEFIPFSICLGSLVIYILYVLHIKLHPQIIVTDRLMLTLKIYLIIALVSLFIGLLIVFIKKIFYLRQPLTSEKKVVSERVKEEKIVVDNGVTKEVVTKETVVKPNYTYKLDDVVCPECGGSISKRAAICPHCGVLFDKEVLRILKKHDKRKKKRPLNPFWVVLNIILIVILIILIIIVSKAIYNTAKTNRSNILHNIVEKI